ncbi:MAG: Trm112 family protein [Chloroflexi bacterium]|nr:methytransferase partner Trm112 [Chloroflexota bacterium]MDA1146959.1 methytransferase partner Trm112 [Chloroflexota bacterium]MQC82345.1 Trm112 family protein [Chloroflexota bacterium]MQC83013.1 Trm112 family protein [Chloroflexota bacterium]
MRRDLMDILVCPVTKSALTLEVTREADGEVLEGTLRCAEGHSYPIADGIPNLLPPDLREAIDGAAPTSGHGS